jgi:Tol biopolymer transport system component
LVVVDRDSDSEPCALFALSVESGEKRRLTSPPLLNTGDGGPRFSPDGRMIAFVRAVDYGLADLYLLSVREGLRTVGEPKRLTSGRWLVFNPAWAPEGRDIIFSTIVSGWAGEGLGNLWRVAANGPVEPRRLAVGENGASLSISQQRRRLVYSREVSDANIWRVGISHPQSKVAIPERFIFSTRYEGNPQFSPDGKRIAFYSNRSGSGEIWTCDYDGSNPVQLNSFGRGESASPRWSPDSRWVSFDSNIDGQIEVYVVNANGGRPRRLTSHPAADAVPSWSGDGKWIYFGSNRSGNYQVWKMPASGGEASQVTQKGGFVPLESQDGKFVYYMKGYTDRRIWKVPSEGGEELQVLGPIFRRDFDVAKNGIYFIAEPNSSKSHSIRFFNFATAEIKSIASIENPIGNYISVSPAAAGFCIQSWTWRAAT